MSEKIRHRKSLRLKEFDYSTNAAYFVTICSKNRANIFSSVVGAVHPDGPRAEPSAIGRIVEKHIQAIPNVYVNVFVDAYVIMPNHVHLILRIDNPQGSAGCPTPTAELPKIISALKSLSSRDADISLWQRGYYEHICRDYRDYIDCCRYIDSNPLKWAEDEYYS